MDPVLGMDSSAEPHTSSRQALLVAAVCAVCAFVLVVMTRGAPGFTSDEPFNALYGKQIVAALLRDPSLVFNREKVDELFGRMAEHPPLGRYAIGLVSYLFDPNFWNTHVFEIRAARWASVLEFALLVAIVGFWATRRSNWAGGLTAGLLCLSLPRLFGHGHFSALETPLCLTYTLATLALTRWSENPRILTAVPAGLATGATLLTKMQGIFLVPVVLLVAGLKPRRYWRTALLLLMIALIVFFAGWPWLWYAPLPRVAAYLGRGVERSATLVTFFGTVYKDKQVPFTYPFVLFLLTLPAGHVALLAVSGMWRVRCRSLRTGDLTLLSCVLLPLVVFALPGVPVYDGVRLFLMVYPPLLAWAGWSTGLLYRHRLPALVLGLSIAAVAAGFWGIYRTHPCYLSYYTELIGGLRGAERLGLQLTYWGDSVTPDLLARWSQEAPRGATLRIVPTLYDGHEEIYWTREMQQRAQRVVPQNDIADYTLIYRRVEYLPPDLLQQAARARTKLEIAVEQVWLTRILPGAAGQEDDSR